MELFLELLFTIAFSLVSSFVVATLLSKVSAYFGCASGAQDDAVSTPVTIVHEQSREQQSVRFDSSDSAAAGEVEGPLVIDYADEFSGEGEVCKVEEGEREEEERVCVGGDDLVGESYETATFYESEIHSVEESQQRLWFSEIVELVKDGASADHVEGGEFEKEDVSSVGGDEVVGKAVDRSSDTAALKGFVAGLVEEKMESFKDEKDCDLKAEGDGLKGNEEELFDDWEGIERTDLEKCFGAAVVFMGSKSNADRVLSIGSDVKMQFYGLHKVATEGACREPLPMALKISARAKFAWKQLGNMSPEAAMEQYINLLSRSIPEWMGDDTADT
ncbi:hypothetical protein RJ639_034960 [Escallonia herrerae]|uniref:ACB domain-containing protein n=1 Tax=Escallonia herrerae TaxID=1293975 RepID=A0AA89BDH8_9ASTE|nr:hypothetical protein RJ639_034960 [Escallonia herrerae]